jgi:spore coat protein U-like protein
MKNYRQQFLCTFILVLLNLFIIPVGLSASCSIENFSINLGNYKAIDNFNREGFGSLTINCDSNIGWTLSVTPGNSGNCNARYMNSANSPSKTLNYNLFIDASYATIWGDGVNCGLSRTGTGTQTIYIYGRIPQGQGLPSGTYNDTLTATLTY